MRAARMQALRLVDLPKLRAHPANTSAQRRLREAGQLPDIERHGPRAGEVDPGSGNERLDSNYLQACAKLIHGRSGRAPPALNG